MKGKLTAHFDSVESAERAALRVRSEFPGISTLRVKPLGKLQEDDGGVMGFAAIPAAISILPYSSTDMNPVGGIIYGGNRAESGSEPLDTTEAVLMVTGEQSELPAVHDSLINQGGYGIGQG